MKPLCAPPLQAESIAAEKGFELPQDYALAAQSGGLRASTLMGFAAVQVSTLHYIIPASSICCHGPFSLIETSCTP